MKLAQIATVTGFFAAATGLYVALGGTGFSRILKNVNDHRCENQSFERIRAENISADGSTSYDKDSAVCVYSYTDKDNKPAELVWDPQ